MPGLVPAPLGIGCDALRATLREFYPAALVAFGDDLADRDAVAVLEPAR